MNYQKAVQQAGIITWPNPILEAANNEITFPLSDEDKKLISQMWKKVNHLGVGLAAPQVGVNKKITIINMSEFGDFEELTKEEKKIKDFVMINPKIIATSDIKNEMIEGCLSFPEEYYYIKRPANVAVEYYDENGKKVIIKAKNWLARVLQHEIDHLEGVVFIKKGGKKAIFEM